MQTFTISGATSADPAGGRTIGPITITNTSDVGETWQGPMATGDNTIQVPQGAIAALIVPPTTGATLKLRTNLNASDAGLLLSATAWPLLYTFNTFSPPTQLIINSNQTVPALLTCAFL